MLKIVLTRSDNCKGVSMVIQNINPWKYQHCQNQ